MTNTIKSRSKLTYCKICDIYYSKAKCPMCKIKSEMQDKINDLEEDIEGLYQDMAGESI